MSDIKSRILRALFQGATITVAAGSLAACGTSEEDPSSNNGWNVQNNQNNKNNQNNQNNKQDMTGDMSGDMSEDMDPKDMKASCDTTDLDRYPNKVNFDPLEQKKYIVCAKIDALNQVNLSCGGINEQNAQQFLDASIEASDGCTESFVNRNDAELCGPVTGDADECCYVINVETSICAVGRPFIVDGMVRTAACAQREGWLADGAQDVDWSMVESLPEDVRLEIAAAWANTGCHEHASIASFSAFMMDLMQLGAPKSLVELTTKAIKDEIDHAARCFAIASAFAGMPLGPEEIDTNLPARQDIQSILIAAIDEGCIGETCAAAQADLEAQRANHPYIKQTLQTISDDETDHAILAWQFVDWVLTEHPELVDVAKEAFETHAMRAQTPWLDGMTARQQLCQAHGYTNAAQVDIIRRRAYQNIVLPCADALWEKHATASVRATL